jgi:hypothetical protein
MANHHLLGQKMRQVEQCWRLLAGEWQRSGCFRTDSEPGIAKRLDDGAELDVSYGLIDGRISITSTYCPSLQYEIELELVQTPFGMRHYLRCPIRGCGRRCQALWLPESELRFACRQCHRLTWRSSQTQRAGERLARRLKLLGVAGDFDFLSWL